VYLPFEESDYELRVPLEGFEKWKELEDLVLSIG